MPTHRGDSEPLRAEPGGRQYESHLYPSTRERRMRSRVGAPIATWEGRDRGRVWAVVRTAPCQGLPRRRRLARRVRSHGLSEPSLAEEWVLEAFARSPLLFGPCLLSVGLVIPHARLSWDPVRASRREGVAVMLVPFALAHVGCSLVVGPVRLAARSSA